MAKEKNFKKLRQKNDNHARQLNPTAPATIKTGAGETPGRPPACAAAGPRLWIPLCAVVMGLSCFLLFFRLGHYPLWSDEAETALYARGIARTGDTITVIDHNICAFSAGSQLKNLHYRYMPPASLYLAAPFVGASGEGTFWPRFPFAFCGLLSIALILYWMVRSRLSAAFWIVTSIVLLCNVELFLFCRQCRYYSLAMLLSIAIVYLYLNWNGRTSGILWLLLASLLLMWTHYLSYAGLYVVLGCDYLLFGRRQYRLTTGQWLLLLVPQFFIGLVTFSIYNPYTYKIIQDLSGQSVLQDKITLFWWYFRDLNNCEFCMGFVILATPIVYFWTRNVWLLRGFAALVVYTIVIVIFTPQRIGTMIQQNADVRYLSSMIPLCIGLSSLVIASLTRRYLLFALPAVVLLFGTNILNFPFSIDKWRSRPVQFVNELFTARTTSIDVAGQWIKENVGKGQSIGVLPDSMECALMYYAPHPVYAWHLRYPPEEQFAKLPLIHFFGRIPPDYFVVFGPYRIAVEGRIKELQSQGAVYKLVETLPVYWNDLTRPEILWRSLVRPNF